MKWPIRSYHALSPKKQAVWRAVRPAVPARPRLFFEGALEVPGQLWYAERKLLYNTVRRSMPRLVLEVGTWKGGGSTLFIARALCDNNAGIIHTIEEDEALFELASSGFRDHLPDLVPYVRFHQGRSTEVLPSVIREMGGPDMVILDGAEDSEQSMSEFSLLRPYLAAGATLVVHDWESEKARQVRLEIVQGGEWQIDHELTWPKSVGMAICSLRSH